MKPQSKNNKFFFPETRSPEEDKTTRSEDKEQPHSNSMQQEKDEASKKENDLEKLKKQLNQFHFFKALTIINLVIFLVWDVAADSLMMD